MGIRPHYWTEDEYLAFERASNSKHEYFDGQIYDMVGASFNHNLIAANVHFALRSALGVRLCFVLQSDLCVALQNAYVYPDVVVVCGAPQLINQDILSNPKWLFTLYEGLETAVALPKLGVELPLSAIYVNILFAESE